MVSDEYAPLVRGGLKLKGGSKPSGIAKTKKKAKKTKEPEPRTQALLQKALEDEDSAASKEIEESRKESGEEEGLDEGKELGVVREEERGNDGKTASERAHEEMRRKRVCVPEFASGEFRFWA